MATERAKKVGRAMEKQRIIQDARDRTAAMDDFVIANDPRVTFSPDGYWVEAWIKLPLSAAQEKKGK